MTLIVAVIGRESIWMLADRRVTYEGRPPKEDALKLMRLETTDGIALLGYAGLGATAGGTEPSAWMNRVLCGRVLPLEECLAALAAAIEAELPRHLDQLPSGAKTGHVVIAAAFVRNEPRLYSIELTGAVDGRKRELRWKRWVNSLPNGSQRPLRIGVAGSGTYLSLKDRSRLRNVLRMIRAHEAERTSADVVADVFADLNMSVHRSIKSVGPRCVVAWSYARAGSKGGEGISDFITALRKTFRPFCPSMRVGST